MVLFWTEARDKGREVTPKRPLGNKSLGTLCAYWIPTRQTRHREFRVNFSRNKVITTGWG